MIGEICADTRPEANPAFEILKEYVAIKTAEKEVEKKVGLWMLLEALEKETGKEKRPLGEMHLHYGGEEEGTGFKWTDAVCWRMMAEWKAFMEEYINPTKAQKLEVLMLFDVMGLFGLYIFIVCRTKSGLIHLAVRLWQL